LMSVVIVVGFEIIDIDNHQRNALVFPFGSSQFLRKHIVKMTTIEQRA